MSFPDLIQMQIRAKALASEGITTLALRQLDELRTCASYVGVTIPESELDQIAHDAFASVSRRYNKQFVPFARNAFDHINQGAIFESGESLALVRAAAAVNVLGMFGPYRAPEIAPRVIEDIEKLEKLAYRSMVEPELVRAVHYKRSGDDTGVVRSIDLANQIARILGLNIEFSLDRIIDYGPQPSQTRTRVRLN